MGLIQDEYGDRSDGKSRSLLMKWAEYMLQSRLIISYRKPWMTLRAGVVEIS